MIDPPALSDEFLAMLRCPVASTPLTLAGQPTLDRVNRAIEAGMVRSRIGEPVERLLDAALVNQDGSLLYAIYDGIPTLIGDEAIPLDQIPPTP